MKMLPKCFPVFARMLLLPIVFCLGACRDKPHVVESEDAETRGASASKEVVDDQEQETAGVVAPTGDAPSPGAQITELQRAIESGREDIDNLEAFVQMERAKVENDPDYETSFLDEALAEQQEIRETVEAVEQRLQELTRTDE